MNNYNIVQLWHGDCLNLMSQISSQSINLILSDPPYCTTSHSWDKEIPLTSLWEYYKRIIKPFGVIVIFSTQPFTTKLISSNYSWYRYNWTWVKESPNGFLNSHYSPLKITEDVCVFSPAKVGSLSKNPIPYHPPCWKTVNKQKKNNPSSMYRAANGYSIGGNKLNSDTEYVQKYTNHPTNILTFPRDKKRFHPTQKPVSLLEFLIKTYTEKGDVILDNCMGSGSTGVACVNTERRFIGIEKEKKYFSVAEERIKKVVELRNVL